MIYQILALFQSYKVHITECAQAVAFARYREKRHCKHRHLGNLVDEGARLGALHTIAALPHFLHGSVAQLAVHNAQQQPMPAAR